jgi:hypothetical protein
MPVVVENRNQRTHTKRGCSVLTWRAKPALTPIPLRNPFLGWMWPFDIPNPLNRDNVLPVYTDQRRETCVYGGMVDLLRCGVEL